MIDWGHNAESLQCHNEGIKLNADNNEVLMTDLKFGSAIGLRM